MKQVLDFLNKAGVYYLATTDGDQPHVRPIGFVMEHNGKLAFCTSNNKDMYKQLISNPKVEICAFSEGSTLRICGKVAFETSEETQNKALKVMPALGDMYSVGDGVFEIFYLSEGKAVCGTMAGETQEWSL